MSRSNEDAGLMRLRHACGKRGRNWLLRNMRRVHSGALAKEACHQRISGDGAGTARQQEREQSNPDQMIGPAGRIDEELAKIVMPMSVSVARPATISAGMVISIAIAR
jgi:hypothetical protein